MINDLTNGCDVIVFDGECVLCSGFFNFLLQRDRSQRFMFVLAQSPLGARMYEQLGLPVRDFETNLVIVDGHIYQRMDAFAAAMRALPGGWPVLSVIRFFPAAFKDRAYRFVAVNRYKFFGRKPVCLVPDDALRSRFLPEGF